MLKLGITGGIGSGKSTVSQLLELLSIPVYYADIESKRLTATSSVIKEKLIDAFGSEIYSGGGGILNKPLLASLIFNDKKKLKTVNEIIHPEVIKDFINWAERHKTYPIIAHEAAILFESGLNIYMDKTVLVYTPLDIRINRVMQRDNISKEKVLERINNQMSDEDKIKLSDYVIYNDNNHSLISQTVGLLNNLNHKI